MHPTRALLLAGLAALLAGCENTTFNQFTEIATADTTELIFCCDPNAPFPQPIGTIQIQVEPDVNVRIDRLPPTLAAEVEVAFLDGDSQPVPEEQAVIKRYTIELAALSCPPEVETLDVRATRADGFFGVETVTVRNECLDDPGGGNADEILINDPDQLSLGDGPAEEVTADVPILYCGTDDNVVSVPLPGTAADCLPITTSSYYGGVLMRDVASGIQALYAYGPNGGSARHHIAGDWTATFLDIAGNTTDFVPTADDPTSGEAVITRFAANRIQFYRFNSSSDLFEVSGNFLGAHLFPGAVGNMISSCRPETGGPLFVLFRGTPSKLFVKDNPNDLAALGRHLLDFGDDARRLRAEGNLLFVTDFTADTVYVVRREANGSATIVETVPVGDGPIGIDAKPLLNEEIALLSTGFNGGTYTITTVTASGALLTNVTTAIPNGGLGSSSAVFLPDGRIAISCNASDKIVITDP